MPLKELGAKIQAARQARGWSVEDAALKLKIHRYTLTAIEEGSLQDMPEEVYARSFTRSYASLVGIDPAFVLEVVDQVFPLEKTPEYIEKTDLSVPFRPKRKSKKHTWLAILLLIILAAAGTWYYLTQVRVTAQTPPTPPAVEAPAAASPPTPAAPATEPDAADEPAAETNPEPTAEGGQASTADPTRVTATRETGTNGTGAANAQDAARSGASTLGGATAQAGQETPAALSGESARTVTPVAEAPAAAPTPAPTPARTPETADAARSAAQAVGPNSQHSLVVSATEQAWFSIIVDGAYREYTFQRGQSAEFTFKRQATLRMGNAGGVSLTYNGTRLPSPGAHGQVRTLVFPPTS